MAMNFAPAQAIRHADAAALAVGLSAARRRTLALLAAYADALGPDLSVPYRRELNPPRWEAGHVTWFQDYWIARNRQRARGLAADPEHERPPGRLATADAWYDSSHVAHTTRWELPLPDLTATRTYMSASLDESLSLLAKDAALGQDLYFYKLALLHEDMHTEAGVYMAQALDIPLPPGICADARIWPPAPEIVLGACRWRLGWSRPVLPSTMKCPRKKWNCLPTPSTRGRLPGAASCPLLRQAPWLRLRRCGVAKAAGRRANSDNGGRWPSTMPPCI